MKIFRARTSDTDRRIEQLRRVPGLGACSRRDLKTLLQLGDETMIPAGTVLARQDEVPRWAYLILDGRVAIADGSRVHHEGPGWWASTADAALSARAQQTTVVAGETRAISFTRPHLVALLESAPTIGLAIFRTVSGRLLEATAPNPVATVRPQPSVKPALAS